MANSLESFISMIVKTLIGMVEEEVHLVLGVPGEIQKLQRTLRKIQLVLHDAEQRRIDVSAINDWLKELKDVMYDADDILDLYRIAAEQRTQRESSSKASTEGCSFPGFSCLRQLKNTHDIGSKIKRLNLKLEEISTQSSQLDLKASSKPREEVSRVSRKTSPVMESDIVGVGIDGDARSLVELLTKENASGNVLVLAIVGIGGIGKTTLAQKVFHDDKIKVNFRKMMWVCVSQEFTDVDLLRNIITSAGGSHGGEQNKELLEPMVEGLLRGDKFLLVLDDVWHAQIWEDMLRNPFQRGAVGSRVLVTTRDEGIAKRMKAFHIHKMKLLPPEDCWSLLRKKLAVNNADEERDVEGLKDIGMKIVEKCQGLPLAIKTIGGVLCERGLSRGAWEEVLRSAAWSQTGLPGVVRGALYLSYEELPSHLKQCFVYCALFREDFVFKDEEIVQLWIAEGFVQEEGDLTLEATGKDYFRELVRRSLLQSYTSDDHRFKMHDLLRSLGQSLTRDENLVIGDARKALKDEAASMKLRRLSILASATGEIQAIIRLTKRQESVRTLLLDMPATADKMDLDDYFKNFLRLRVLHLPFITSIKKLPHNFGNLVHLRYLNLCYGGIKELPESIGNLTYLQFLILTGCEIKYVPKGVVKLHNLRVFELLYSPLEGLPSGIGRLEHLNELDGFVVSDNNTSNDHHLCSLEEVSTLRKLRLLSIHKLERAAWIEAEPRRELNILKGNQNLEILHLLCSPRQVHNEPTTSDYTEEEIERIEKVFDTTLHPPSSLQDLRLLDFFGLRYPSWLTSNRISSLLPNLRKLDLANCCECCPRLPPLGKLPSLEFLIINGASAVVTIGPEFFGCEAAAAAHDQARKSNHPPVLFPRLMELQLYRMLNLEKWHWVAEDQGLAMPRLNKLNLSRSPKLESLPEGLSRQATCLNTLFLFNVGIKSISGFPSVKELCVNGEQENLVIISDLPSLEVLKINMRPCEIRLPEWLVRGLADLNALQRLEIQGSNQLLRSCLQKGADWPNIKDVPIVYIKDEKSNYINYIKHSSTFNANLIDGDEDDNGC